MKVPSYKKQRDINKGTGITETRKEAVCAYLGKMNEEMDAHASSIDKGF